jgi:hypothetical protein
MNQLIDRMQQDTPQFFKKLRNGGILLAAISAAILTTPVALPAIVTKIAGYMAVGSSVMSAVSQAAVKNERQ